VERREQMKEEEKVRKRKSNEAKEKETRGRMVSSMVSGQGKRCF
jgi:hypothetical protein